MLPRAEDTTTLRPLRSATLSIFEPGGTRMAMPRAELRRAAMIFSGVPPVAAASTGVSPAGARSTAPARSASNSGAAPWKLAHCTLYGASARVPAASTTVRRPLAWSPRIRVTSDQSVAWAALARGFVWSSLQAARAAARTPRQSSRQADVLRGRMGMRGVLFVCRDPWPARAPDGVQMAIALNG